MQRLARPLGMALGLAVALAASAAAHDETEESDLAGLTLCVEPTSVRVDFEKVPAGRVSTARPALERSYALALAAALRAAGAPLEERLSCRGSPGYTELVGSVLYLDPKNYVGFGDPAYSYKVVVQVNAGSETAARPGEARPRARFLASWSNIHSESRTGAPFERTLTAWGEELAGDLAAAWRADNRRPPFERWLVERPLLLGLVAGALISGLLAAAWAWRAGRRG